MNPTAVTESGLDTFDRSILDLSASVIFFPVRHHSPASARLLTQLIQTLRPSTVLVEGPSDFNDRISELSLPHQLPIAIYSYAHLQDGTRRGAFYPYCDYSPEWQAIQIAGELGIPARFVDLPWSEIASTSASSHRYAESELHQSRYVQNLADKLGVEGLDNLWDYLFEIEAELTVRDYLERCHQFCFHCRILDGCLSKSDRKREMFMANAIRQTMAHCEGQVLVVTGGYHSYALYSQVFDLPFDEPTQCADKSQSSAQSASEFIAEQIEQQTGLQFSTPTSSITHQGTALTPFSYERLDSLSGYNAGMPSPGFYHQVWQSRSQTSAEGKEQHDRPSPYRTMLIQVVKALRAQRQIISSADLIAVESMAQSLANLRGHSEVWRRDILDAVVGALIKEAVKPEQPHPFLKAVQEAFQGQIRGQLARGTMLPPLARHIQAVLSEFDLVPQPQGRAIALNLYQIPHRQKSHVLHQLRILKIAGYQLNNAYGWAAYPARSSLSEEWLIRWSPEFEASCIENAIYGCTLSEAAMASLQEIAMRTPPNAEKAAQLLLDTFLMGLPQLATPFHHQLTSLIQSDSDFFSLAGVLDPLLFLYHYDNVLGTAEQPEVGELLAIAYQRTLWLLGNLGTVQGQSQLLLDGIKALLSTFERCGRSLGLRRELIVHTFTTVSQDTQNAPLLRGAGIGALWRLAVSSEDAVLQELKSVSTPDRLGDFLTGLFHIAREVTQRDSKLLKQIDAMIAAFDDSVFLEALPSLHLAFTYFTPREKHEISHCLVSAWNKEGQALETTQPLEITPEIIAQAQAMEAQAIETIERYGLRGGQL